MLGGWSIATIASFQSGNPFTLFSENNSGELDNFLDRPDVIGPVQIYKNPRQVRTFELPANSIDPTSPGYDPLHYSCVTANGADASGNPTVTGHFYFNPMNVVCAVGPPVGVTDPNLIAGGVPLFTHGNMGRNVLRGPGINNWDFSIQKDFKFRENKSIEFRGEFFNAFNHVQFLSPTFQDGTQGGDGLFGQITSDRAPRIIQFAMKVYF
jgi:hypothetical protein